VAGTLPPIKAEFVANTGPFVKATTAAASSLEKVSAVAPKTAKGLNAVADAVARLTEPLLALADAAKAARTQLSGIATSTNRIAASADKAAAAVDGSFTSITGAAERMGAAVRESTTVASAGVTELGAAARTSARGMQATAAESTVAGSGMRRAGSEAETLGSKVKDTGMKLLGLGAVFDKLKTWGPLSLGAIGVASMVMSTKFQASFTQLMTQAGVAKSSMGQLQSGVLSLAGQVGFSPTSLSEALFHVESSFASTGITGSNALLILKTAAEGAAIGHANLVDVQNALDAAVASGIPGVQNYSQAMGALNAIIGSGDMHMQDLANALGTGVLAVVKGYGVTLNDAGAALATFGDNNIRGAVAATDLRMAVQSLAVPSKAGIELLQKWGVSSTQLATDMQQHGLVYTLNQLHDLFVKNGVTATTQGQIITEMFGKKAGSGLAVLMGQLDRVNSKVPEISKQAGGFAGAWKIASQTLSQQLANMKAGFDSVMISLGTALIPKVSEFLTLLETRGAPIAHAFSSALSGLWSGMGGGPKPAPVAAKGQTSKPMIGSTSNMPMLAAPAAAAAPPPALTMWQKAGEALRSILGDLSKTVGELFKIFGNLWTAIAPLAAVIGGAFLGALKGVTVVLADYLGPALVAVSGFLAKYSGVVSTLIGLFVAWKISAALATAQTLLFDAAADANPISLLVIAIGLLVGGLIMLWQHSQTARNIMTEVFSAVGVAVLEFVKIGLQAIKIFVDMFVAQIGAMIHAAATLFGWVPGIGGQLKGAARDFDGFVKTINNGLGSAISTVGDWQKNLEGLPTQVKLQGNIDDLTKKIDTAKAQLDDKNLPSSKKVTLVGDIANWQKQILIAKMSLASTPDKKQAILTAQITDWQNQINVATAQLKNAPASKTAYLNAEISALRSNVATATNAINSIPNRTVTVNYDFTTTGSPPATGVPRTLLTGNALGGIHIPGLRKAATGLMDRQAGFADKPILWAEAGPEAYIPLDPGKRARSRAIAAETVSTLGGRVSWDGGRALAMSGASHASTARVRAGGGGGEGMTVVNNINIAGSVVSERQLRDVVQKQMLQLGARNSTTYQPYQR
jgi:TP901 family phage tail tape measure protein